MHKQFELLNQICSILLNAPKKIDSLRFIYKFNKNENWDGMDFVTIIDEKKEILPTYFNYDEIRSLCEQLHDSMQKHTGGDWQKFVLTIDEDREVQTEFSYEPQSLYDDWTVVVKQGRQSLPTFLYCSSKQGNTSASNLGTLNPNMNVNFYHGTTGVNP